MTTSKKKLTTARRAARPVSGLGLGLWVLAGCGEVEGGDATSGEVSAPLVNGRPDGGVGVVRLQLTDGQVLPNGNLDDFTCTGTVISGDRVLTAGHCVNKWLTIRDGGDTTVLLQGDLLAGAEYTEDGTSWLCLQDPSQAECSPSVLAPVHVTRLGNGEFPPDVAVIRFATPLQGIESSHFRQLSTGSVRVGQTVDVWGIGFTDPNGTSGGSATNVMMRAVMRLASASATALKISNEQAQICLGDSGGPVFTGASDLIVGMVSQGLRRNGACKLSIDQTTTSRITPAVIDLINNNRGSGDPLCQETIPGTGFHRCH
jgi:hypothetical protein